MASKKSSKGKATTGLPHTHKGTRIALSDGAILLGVFTYDKGDFIGVISISEFNGKTALDIRRFYANEEGEAYSPTPKGIRIPMSTALSMVDLLHDQRSLIASLEQ